MFKKKEIMAVFNAKIKYESMVFIANCCEENHISHGIFVDEIVKFAKKSEWKPEISKVKGLARGIRKTGDPKSIIFNAWVNAGKPMLSGEKIIRVDDVKKYFISTGKSESTASQYVYKKLNYNPIFTLEQSGELKKNGYGYTFEFDAVEEVVENKPLKQTTFDPNFYNIVLKNYCDTFSVSLEQAEKDVEHIFEVKDKIRHMNAEIYKKEMKK